jgi:hypothetical protein
MSTRISRTVLRLFLIGTVMVLLGATAPVSHAQSGSLLQCEIDLTAAIARCYEGNPPPSRAQIRRCVEAAQNQNALCTLSLGPDGGSVVQPDLCPEARVTASQCYADYLSCGGLDGAGCYDAYLACRLSSGIDRCQ